MKQTDLLVVNFLATIIRIGVVILIGFFLTRIVIGQLGLEVFGLFTTIGASGMMLTMVTNTLQLSIARELGVRVGKADTTKLTEAFSTSFFIQLVMGLGFGIVGLTLSGKIVSGLTIPDGYAYATWICLIMTFIQFSVGIVTSPFGGMIRAHQHLTTIATIELISRIAVFGAAVSMIFWAGNKLIFYVTANLVINLLVQLANVVVALRRYEESWPIAKRFSMASARSIFRYGTMALMGGIGGQIRRNGVAIVLNVYFGNLVTAANGIAIRLSNLISQFVGIIIPVVQPAMNVNEGAGNKKINDRLVTLSSTLGLAIIIPVALPMLFDTEALLTFWLNIELPKYAVLFSQLITCTFITTMISKGHGMAMHANGDIGRLTFVNQALVILGIAVAACIACSMNKYPWLLPIGELIGLVLATCFWQPYWVGKKLHMANREWFRFTVFPALLLVGANLLLVSLVVTSLPTSMLRVLLLSALSSCICFAILWVFGLVASERVHLINFVNRSARKLAIFSATHK